MATIRKTFDPSKFTKNITKQISGIQTGFNDPDTWISTGNYVLNKRIQNDFHRGIPLGKLTMLAGAQGSGKSYIASGSIVRHAQEQGIFCVIIDSENALDQKWLEAVGVDTSPDKLMRISASMIDDVAKITSDFIKQFKVDYADVPREERPKVLFVIDSLGMLLTPTDVDQYQSGDMKGDMGRKPKALKALVTNLTNSIGDLNIGIICTNHTYANQNIYSGEGPQVASGGSGIIFASSIVVIMDKLQLKEDEDGQKVKEAQGIRVKAQVAKSRFAQPFKKFEFKIPWDGGLDPYSGLLEFFEEIGIIQKVGNKLQYTSKDGTEYKEFRKSFGPDILDIIMAEYDDNVASLVVDSEAETDSEDYDPETGEVIE